MILVLLRESTKVRVEPAELRGRNMNLFEHRHAKS